VRRHDVLLSLAGMTCFLLTYTAQAAPQPRMALIIGNAAYQRASLRTPVNDATDMAATLHQLGFDSTLLLDVDLRTMQAALQVFSQRLRQGGVGPVLFCRTWSTLPAVSIQGEGHQGCPGAPASGRAAGEETRALLDMPSRRRSELHRP
jgi:hypothetical protein